MNILETLLELQGESGFFYLASPYTGHKKGLLTAYAEAAFIVQELAARDVTVHSSVCQYHQMQHLHKMDYDHDFWMRRCIPFVRSAAGVIVVKSPGWDQSKGVATELIEAVSLEKPLFQITPATPEENSEGSPMEEFKWEEGYDPHGV